MLVPFFSWAQKTHKVGPKESLYSISRLYNVHPRDLAAYNNIPVESTLSIGQVLKIPTKKTLPPLPPVVTDDKPEPTNRVQLFLLFFYPLLFPLLFYWLPEPFYHL